MARSLAERLRAHEQQKARLADQEAKLKDAGRKVRTRRLIEAGGLIEKTGLLDLDTNALYGALLSLRVLTFPNPLPKEATAPLRAAGFHFNKVLQHWEGMTRVDEAQRLAATHGGTARRVTPAPLSEGPATEAA